MTDVSRETEDRLKLFEELLSKWNPTINLVGQGTIPDLRHRHIADSMQLLDHAKVVPDTWLDIGSGGGLPGLVVAALLEGKRTTVTLVESDARKATFLRAAVREMSLSRTIVVNARIEDVPFQAAEILSARALAPLSQLLSHVARHLHDDGLAILPKGRGWKEEIAAAQPLWRFYWEASPSKTDPEAVVLKISKVARA